MFDSLVFESRFTSRQAKCESRKISGERLAARCRRESESAETGPRRELAGGGGLFGLPQLDGIAFGIVYARKAPDARIIFRILGLNSRGAELGHHFVEVAHAEIHHPDFAGIAEIFGGFGKRSEDGRAGFLLPDGLALAGGLDGDSQMLFVPAAQDFGIVRAKEQSTNADHFFHFRSCGDSVRCRRTGSGRRSLGLCARLCCQGELTPIEDEARAESK